jgi:hypothetical protein
MVDDVVGVQAGGSVCDAMAIKEKRGMRPWVYLYESKSIFGGGQTM